MKRTTSPSSPVEQGDAPAVPENGDAPSREAPSVSTPKISSNEALLEKIRMNKERALQIRRTKEAQAYAANNAVQVSAQVESAPPSPQDIPVVAEQQQEATLPTQIVALATAPTQMVQHDDEQEGHVATTPTTQVVVHGDNVADLDLDGTAPTQLV